MPLLKEMDFMEDSEYTIEDILALPEGERAELIDGQMYMMAAPSIRHQRLIGKAYLKIGNYILERSGDCEVLQSPFAVFLNDESNYVEPDLAVICDPSKIDADGGCHGAPDWVMEVVSPSSRSMDYMIKVTEYQTEGVREYCVVDPAKDRVTVYGFETTHEVNEYTLRDAVPVGIYDDLTITFDE